MVSNEGFYRSELELDSDHNINNNNNAKVWTKDLEESKSSDKPYTYDEAIDIAGTGWYNWGLLATLCLAMEGMSLDIFGFSVVVTGAGCDLGLTQTQTTTLLAVPFIGPILMAYFWGYFSDTKGRKKCLMVALWGSFVASVVGSLSPNWIVLLICKLVGTCFSSCIQSVPFALLGESCCVRVRAGFIIVLSAVNMFCIIVYIGFGYLILNLNFSYNMAFVALTPWRLLAIVLGLPLAISGVGLSYFHESPKFLANAGSEKLALDTLRDIMRRNGGCSENYPVTKLVVDSEIGKSPTNTALIESLCAQVTPMFRRPRLWRTVQLFYLTAAIYFTNSSLFMWFPFLFKEFAAVTSDDSHSELHTQNVCSLVARAERAESSDDDGACKSSIDFEMFIISVIQGVIFTVINVGISKMADKRKTVTITLLVTSAACSFAAVLVESLRISVMLFVGTLLSSLCIGIVFSYFVDLYPASYRGMASCLGVMVARGGGWLGVHAVGVSMRAHCAETFYGLAGYLLSAAVMASFLPSNRVINNTKL